ncbi:hypothetical protein PYW08_014315 [Mythimna loreyi]|uniref:Uncharacterized protein n=1 Tax=Mythimna loreyi TaxID=667449 RepID=A0ACC2RBH5_9NEOP|nr:hypothetical protein PYW08_014315 [Mythimna loreyi]
MPRCSASGCRNMGSHTFPKDPKLRILWEKATNKENFKASKHSRLCYDHFKPSDYVDTSHSVGLANRMSPFHRYLKKTAVPSIFSTNIQQSRTNEASENGSQTAAINCKNMGSHTFPKDDKRRKLWIKAIRRKNWKANKSARLCAIHFKPEDYVEQNSYTGDENLRKRLKASAIPSLFLTSSRTFPPHASSLQQKKILCSPTKNNVIKNNTVSVQKTPIKEESNSTEVNNALRNRSVRLKNRKAYLLNRRCSVPHCNARPTNEISLHPCPNNAAVRNEWAEALRVSYQYVKNMVACSLHFSKIDFIQSKNSERVLKYNAVPSRNLPNRKKTVVPVKHKHVKKETTAKAFEKQQTMADTVGKTKEAVQDEINRECRACLKKLDDKKSCCNVFQAWAPPWDGMEASIAEDLAKLANVEITPTDRHSKVLCAPCYQRLLDAAIFAAKVRNCDLLLRMRFTAEIDIEKVWPKPIQVDKNINGSVFNNPMDIEIKQEVVSDEEYPVNGTDNSYVENELANLEIKIEPEELVEPPPMNITINGTISLTPLNSENTDVQNGMDIQVEPHLIQMEVKQEPTSEGEQDIDQTPDLSLECLLCTKSFNSVTGLKAHVIAQHSYKSVKRKADGSVSPEKKRCDRHQCKICKRSFQTSTDLMVHETCHNKHACYGCTEKFDSFELLTRHRKRCKASIGNSVQKLKTLEDVKRPLPEGKIENLQLEIEKIESETTCKEDDIEMKESEPTKVENVEMKDINSEQKDENNTENTLVSPNDIVDNANNTLDGVNVVADSDKNLESVREELDSGKLLESIIEFVEVENDKKLESVVETIDDKLGNTIEEESDNTKTESNIGDFESVEKTTDSENIEDPNSSMKLHLELIHSNDNETEPSLSDADMPVQTLDNDGCT